MLNKALRTQDIELLFRFRFLINDIYEQLKQYQCRSSMRVYRGQAISRDELKILQKSIKKLISINSFFSTSIDFDRAMSFLNNPKISNELVRILFIIDADPQVVTTRPFANISPHSAFKEKEVLFMIGCVFRLIDVQQNDQIWEIHMKLCGDNEHDIQNLFQHMKNEYAGGDQQVELRSFGTVLYKMGKYDLAEIVYRRVLNETSSNNPILSSIYQSLGMIYEEKCEYDNSLEFYREALQAQRENDPSNYVRIGGIYCCIGVIYKKQGDFNRALDYYYDAIELFHKANDDNHRDVASLYNNIAIIYSNQKQYTEALDYYKKMLDIERKYLPANHSDLGMSYSNIGLVYYSLHKYDLAMSYFDQSLEIKLKSLPSDHPLIAKSYVNIGRVYEAQNDQKQALLYFQKAAAIRHKAFSPDHPDVIKIDKDIERIQSKFK
jgi:tetratricopeptide (TPR) repeat protein